MLAAASPWGDVQTYQESLWTPDELFRTRQYVLEQARGISGPGDTLSSVFTGAVSGAASDLAIRVESQLTPEYTYPSTPGSPTSGEGSGIGDWITRNVVKPRVTVLSRTTGRVLAQWEPHGPPTLPLGALATVASVAAAGIVGYYAWRGLTAPRRQANPPRRRAKPRRRKTRRR